MFFLLEHFRICVVFGMDCNCYIFLKGFLIFQFIQEIFPSKMISAILKFEMQISLVFGMIILKMKNIGYEREKNTLKMKMWLEEKSKKNASKKYCRKERLKKRYKKSIPGKNEIKDKRERLQPIKRKINLWQEEQKKYNCRK